ncbi:MAG: hypothetical protein JO250_09390, partial [Armatimonadetes bacterium]|nr:hypothetical protein [Armatimonadota bacterium]
MSVYTITVTLTPEEDAALRAQAARSGQTAEELLRRSVRIPAAPDQATRPDNALQKEYHRRARRVSGTKPPLDRVWQELADAPPLSTAAAVHRGIKYAHFDAAEPRFVSPAEKAGFVPGVWDGRNNVGPYIPRSHGYLTAEGPLRRRAAWDWSAPKVIAPATRVSTGPWIMAVMVDYVGLLCTQRFHGIWRRDIPAAPPLEVLAAALNGPVANAWIASLAAKRDVPIHSLLSLPLPPLSPLTTELITRYVDRYIGRGGEPETLLKIDAAVLDAYGLSAEAERELLASFVGARRPGVPGFTGYGPDFERARAEYRHERALAELGARHQALVEKSFLGGLTPQEA